MKALKLVIDTQPRFYRWEQDRDFLRRGETVSGHVEFDPPGVRPPAAARVVWTDSYGRTVRTTAGRWSAEKGWLEFEFAPEGQVAMANWLEVDLAGERSCRERFVVARPVGPWDEFLVFPWARYPYGSYGTLRELGIGGMMVYKRQPFDHVLENDFECYVDQVSPDEISLYHRPYWIYWEKPEKLTSKNPNQKWFQLCWDMVRQRYKRARERLGGASVTSDAEAIKTLWRASCPSDRGVQEKMRERILNTVLQHKAVRPAFYNLADEAGTGDQGAPFDFCYCKHCLERFRVWLERRYGTLAALNRQWATAFRHWHEVVPRTTDDTLRRQAHEKDFNLSSWADHREFMDDVVTGTYALMREFGRAADPNALYATTGGQGPLAHGGFDFAKIARSVDLHVPYNIYQNDEMLRSFRPRVLKMAPYFGGADVRTMREVLIPRMWQQLFHGDCGQIHWDPDLAYVGKGGRPTAPGRLVGKVLRELTGGIGKQILGMEALDGEIAVLHSQASVRAHWFMGALAEGEKWVDRSSGNTENEENDILFHLRDSTVKLIEDLGLQYRFLAYDALAAGALQKDGFKVLVLPHALAMSPAECAAVRAFAEAGGTVIADALPAVMDEHCRMLPEGQLDDFFGVSRKRFDYRVSGAAIDVPGDGGPLGLPKGRLAVRCCEPTLRATGDAIACGRAGKAAALVVRLVGRGMAVYLNAELRDYFQGRCFPGTPRGDHPRTLAAAALALGGVSRRVSLWTADGRSGTGRRQVPGAEVVRFGSGPVQLVGAVANFMRRTTGVGEEMAIGLRTMNRPSALTVELSAPAHVYESRTGRYHGLVRTFPGRFDPNDANLWALLPYRVTALTARPLGPARTRSTARVEVLLGSAPAAAAGRHVVRVDVYDPRGRWCGHYSKNVVTAGGRGELEIPFAESDRPGAWRLELRDAVTGRRAAARLRVAGGK
ncbi:MAG TPA: beta-galactosidase [Planctomycetota bacterium]|nr:beta-galactosidase [Planctomycetota bacterium]